MPVQPPTISPRSVMALNITHYFIGRRRRDRTRRRRWVAGVVSAMQHHGIAILIHNPWPLPCLHAGAIACSWPQSGRKSALGVARREFIKRSVACRSMRARGRHRDNCRDHIGTRLAPTRRRASIFAAWGAAGGVELKYYQLAWQFHLHQGQRFARFRDRR